MAERRGVDLEYGDDDKTLPGEEEEGEQHKEEKLEVELAEDSEPLFEELNLE